MEDGEVQISFGEVPTVCARKFYFLRGFPNCFFLKSKILSPKNFQSSYHIWYPYKDLRKNIGVRICIFPESSFSTKLPMFMDWTFLPSDGEAPSFPKATFLLELLLYEHPLLLFSVSRYEFKITFSTNNLYLFSLLSSFCYLIQHWTQVVAQHLSLSVFSAHEL